MIGWRILLARTMALAGGLAVPATAIAQSDSPLVVSPRVVLEGTADAGPKPLVAGVVLESPIGWVEAMRIPAGPIALVGGSRIELTVDLVMPRALLAPSVAAIPSGARLYCTVLFGRYNMQFGSVATAIAPGRSANKLPAFALCAVADVGGETFSRLVVLDRKGGEVGHADLAAPMPLRAARGVAMPDGERATVSYRGGVFDLEIQHDIYQNGARMDFDRLEGWRNGQVVMQPRYTYARLPALGETVTTSVLGAQFAIKRVGPGKNDLTIDVLKGFDRTAICNNLCTQYYARWKGVLDN